MTDCPKNFPHCNLYYINPSTNQEEKVGMAIGIDLIEEGNDKMNNEVLHLYKVRKEEALREQYKSVVEEVYNNLPEVTKYNDLVKKFDEDLEKLAEEYNSENYKPFERTGYSNTYKYELTSDIREKIYNENKEDFEQKCKKLEDLVKEVSAQLSLSDDLDYQIEVLKKYEILDKEGKLNI